MGYYRYKYRNARKQWLDLAEQEAHRRNLEFKRDHVQEIFQVPGDRGVRVRASMDQGAVVKLIIDNEIRAINGEYEDVPDKILLVILLISNPNEFNPDTDDFVPVRDYILTSEEFTTKRADGKTQLTIDTSEPIFTSRKNDWDQVFEV